MNIIMKRSILFLFTFFFSVISFSQVRLPKLVSDGMVLQRDTKVKIWGWADKKFVSAKAKIEGDKVIVSRDNVLNPLYVRLPGLIAP